MWETWIWKEREEEKKEEEEMKGGRDIGRERDMTGKKNKEIHVNESSARKKRGRMKRHQDEMCVADS